MIYIGLENPEPERANTLHNLGFHALREFHRRFALKQEKWREEKGAQITELDYNGSRVLLVLPHLGMNSSGKCIAAILQSYSQENFAVVYDEMDLPPGTVRLKIGAKSDKHNGLRDIVANIGSADFLRVRGGVGHPRKLSSTSSMPPIDWLLSDPESEELRNLFQQTRDRSVEAMQLLLDQPFAKAQMIVHQK